MFSRLALRLSVFALPAVWAAGVAQGDPLFHFLEKPGIHGVGLRVVEQYDYSRPYAGDRARPLQTLVWYPARVRDAPRMTVSDYVGLWATETSFAEPRLPERAREWRSALAPTLATPLWAVRDAPAVTERFPIVIYAPSFSSVSWENADLCEYLASHGYVVIAAPSFGAKGRDMTLDLAGAETQARDIAFLVGYALTLPNTNGSHIAVAGFSWGGMSNLFVAARDDRIDALVALDGTLRYYPGVVQESRDVRPERMTIPLLYFGQGTLTLEEYLRQTTEAQRSGPNALNAWQHGDLLTVHMLRLTHREYSSMYQRNESFWSDFHRKWYPAGYERADGPADYAWIARYTLQFLNAYLKHDATALAFLKRRPMDNGVPRSVMVSTFRERVALTEEK
jgi:hypothetical protein